MLLRVSMAMTLVLGPYASAVLAAPEAEPESAVYSAWATSDADVSAFVAWARADLPVYRALSRAAQVKRAERALGPALPVFAAEAVDWAMFTAEAAAPVEPAEPVTSTASPDSETVDWVAEAEQGPDAPSAQRLMRRRVGQDQEDALPADPVFPAPVPVGTNDDAIAIPDRWRLVEALDVKNENLLDPYNQNTLKADRPIFGREWFLNVLLVSDSLAELRRLPTPVGGQFAEAGGKIDQFAEPEQTLFNQNFITSFSLIKGNTVFRPPDWEFRFTGVTNVNYSLARAAGVLRADPSKDPRRRFDQHFGIQEFFIDKHLWNKSDRYDFDSLRIGVQPFISDFRGFLFQDQQPGIRLFGNFINNRVQYNLAWFRRLNKDTNSGLNEFEFRNDDVFIANLYYQDFPVLGFQLQGTVIYNKNREGDRTREFNENGLIVRPASVGNEKPHNYDVFYLGFNGDGHFDRLNLTFSVYQALGTDERNQIADRSTDINALFGAVEASVDFDWYRIKGYALFASGDENPLDSKAEGFDAIFENPQFAGFDTSFFQRQSIPLIAGGNVILAGRNAFIPSLRSSKEEGQSNFVNPGIRMVGIGADFDILPELRLILNASYLDFDATNTLQFLRNRGKIDRHIGEDLSCGIIYRPLFINNVMIRASFAALFPGKGFDDLFDTQEDHFSYSALLNVILTY